MKNNVLSKIYINQNKIPDLILYRTLYKMYGYTCMFVTYKTTKTHNTR